MSGRRVPPVPQGAVMPMFARWLMIAWLWPVLAPAAELFPASPVRILLPVTPGGATDFVARLMQPGLHAALGQPVVIENRPGAGGKIAVETAARATPDGYTMLFGNVGAMAINPSLFRSFPVDPVRDFVCLGVVADSTAVIVSHSSLPVKTLREFIDYARARPGQINYGAANPASPARLGMEVLARKAGIDLVGVMYKGSGDVSIALLSGEVGIASASIPAVIANIKSGQLRALAIKSRTRSELLPEVPTFDELGFPELTISSWQALYVPARTPAARAKILHDAIARVAADPQIAEKAKPGGMSILKPGTAAECAEFTRAQIRFWATVVKQAGIAGSM